MNEQSKAPDIESPQDFRIVEVTREPVELFKILKFEGIASSGGEAKATIASGKVLLNGAIETQKRKKIVSGDTIEIGDDKIRIQLSTIIINKDVPKKTKAVPAATKKPGDRKAISVNSKKSTKKTSMKKTGTKKISTKRRSTKK